MDHIYYSMVEPVYIDHFTAKPDSKSVWDMKRPPHETILFTTRPVTASLSLLNYLGGF